MIYWLVADGCEAAAPSLFFGSAAAEPRAAGFSAAESTLFEHPVTAGTVAAKAIPAIQPMVVFL
ncbi:hypothetical protein [Streptomyces sp. 7N604]|uniref:hypothetical protein n=1 Tax=Streptomyces sp. 7N604 TaxID=3457415 RepID=UPI003FCF5998